MFKTLGGTGTITISGTGSKLQHKNGGGTKRITLLTGHTHTDPWQHNIELNTSNT